MLRTSIERSHQTQSLDRDMSNRLDINVCPNGMPCKMRGSSHRSPLAPRNPRGKRYTETTHLKQPATAVRTDQEPAARSSPLVFNADHWLRHTRCRSPPSVRQPSQRSVAGSDLNSISRWMNAVRFGVERSLRVQRYPRSSRRSTSKMQERAQSRRQVTARSRIRAADERERHTVSKQESTTARSGRAGPAQRATRGGTNSRACIGLTQVQRPHGQRSCA